MAVDQFDLCSRVGTRNAIVAAVFVLMIFMLYRQKPRLDKWQICSTAFITQVNALGNSLKPGDTGIVHVSVEEADELVIIPNHAARKELKRCLPDRPSALIDRLYAASCDDHTSPALAWLQGQRILSIVPVKFSVGVNLSPRSWALRGGCDIRVVKETISLNPFLSLEFQREPEVKPNF